MPIHPYRCLALRRNSPQIKAHSVIGYCGVDRFVDERQPLPTWKNSMQTWLDHDPIALAVLVIGIAIVELLALSI